MATVHLARDVKHDREVALKVLRPDLSAVIGAERFLAEVRITARLDHPHILTLIDSGVADGLLYYVLPYVRGESLRARLSREKQLGLDEALSITRQVASALEYAHKQGVVHRDIKPENILLHEGEAVLTDFGIALAVKEAGGNRLTETGLSLGTPQYMSPEQATGDRTLDARSDVYSLGAVLYEMLAGEPPVTGATAQAVIAKLLTERPTRLRVVRDTVPDGVERAVEKALAKVPADRFSSAGEFARALDIAMTSAHAAAHVGAHAPASRKAFWIVAGAAAVAAFSATLWIASRSSRSGPVATLRDRTQITFTGHARLPAISGDGKLLATVATNCRPGGCTYGIDLQDVGGPSSRRLYDGASAIYHVAWAPDRRNVLFRGSVGGLYGEFLLSTLGGEPRRVASQEAGFISNGDSLVVRNVSGRAYEWIGIAGLDGVVRDSIHLARPFERIIGVHGAIGSPWIFVGLSTGPKTEWRVVDRRGHLASRIVADPGGLVPAKDAVWIITSAPGASQVSLVRYGFDAARGKLAARADTLYSGNPTGVSVTDDGATLVIDEGTNEYSSWVLDFDSALRGTFPDQARLQRGTGLVGVHLSPDGRRVVGFRTASNGERQWFALPPNATTEVPLTFDGLPLNVYWSDSATLAFVERKGTSVQLGLFDFATRTRRNVYAIPDSMINDFSALPNAAGWAWIGSNDRVLNVRRGSETRTYPAPAWYSSIRGVDVSPDGKRAAITGWKAPAEESRGMSVMSLEDGHSELWIDRFAESGGVRFTNAGVLVNLTEAQDIVSVYLVTGPQKYERLGVIPRPVIGYSLSDDRNRIALDTRDYKGDAWMSRVSAQR